MRPPVDLTPVQDEVPSPATRASLASTLDEGAALQALAALSQSARLRAYRALVGAGQAGLTPGVLSAMLGLPGSTLSFHLKALQVARLIDVERASRHLVYRASVPRMNALLAYLTDHCCGGKPCGLVTPSTLAGAAIGNTGTTSPCC